MTKKLCEKKNLAQRFASVPLSDQELQLALAAGATGRA
jgi:hypothetical protein